jgi:hypothetical protein
MVRHKDAWDEKHHVFFGESTAFYQNTALAPATAPNPNSGNFRSTQTRDTWVCETAEGHQFGRFQIQVTSGDYQNGVLQIEFQNIPEGVDPTNPLAELITSQFLGRGLDTLKIFPLGILAEKHMRNLSPEPPRKILCFSRECLNTPIYPLMFQFDGEQWTTSEIGKSVAEKLTWLSRRVERANGASKREKNEAKRPWLFSLLLRRRKRDDKMIHPLDKIRSRCY